MQQIDFSMSELSFDVMIPMDERKATHTFHYDQRLKEHRQWSYLNEQNSFPIEQQVKITGELFENDRQTKIDFIIY